MIPESRSYIFRWRSRFRRRLYCCGKTTRKCVGFSAIKANPYLKFQRTWIIDAIDKKNARLHRLKNLLKKKWASHLLRTNNIYVRYVFHDTKILRARLPTNRCGRCTYTVKTSFLCKLYRSIISVSNQLKMH